MISRVMIGLRLGLRYDISGDDRVKVKVRAYIYIYDIF